MITYTTEVYCGLKITDIRENGYEMKSLGDRTL